MNYQKLAKKWNDYSALEPDVREELTELLQDEKALEDAFYTTLAFGTGDERANWSRS